MKGTDYGPLNVNIRAKENNLLNRGHFDRMLGANSFDEAVTVLRETTYRNDVDQIRENREYNRMLMNELQRIFSDLFELAPQIELIEMASLRYTYHNMKVIFKEEYTGNDYSDLYIKVSRYDFSEYRKAIRTGQSDVLSDEYLESIRQTKESVEEYNNPYSIDIILDRRYLTHLRRLAEELEEKVILDLIIKQIDYYNMSTVVRAVRQGRTKNFLKTILSSSGTFSKKELIEIASQGLKALESYLSDSPYRSIIEEAIDDQTKELAPVKIDYLTDNQFMQEIRAAKLQAFGPLPTLAYLYAKEIEVKNLRLVLAGKETNTPSETIRERMRLNYGQ